MVTDGRAPSFHRHEYSSADGSFTLVELALARRLGARGDLAARWARGLNRCGLGTGPNPSGDAGAHGVRGGVGGFGLSGGLGDWSARVFLSHGPAGTEEMVHDHVAAVSGGDDPHGVCLGSGKPHVLSFSDRS